MSSEIKLDNYFYNINDDISRFPEACYYIIFGGRNTGKTYSCLKKMITEKRKFVFMRRCNNDIDLLCAGDKISQKYASNSITVNISPFQQLNKDMGWNIRPFKIADGLGIWFECNEKNEPVGEGLGYLVSFNAIEKAKGFEMQDAEYIIWDEFVQKIWERSLNVNEGTSLAELWQTVNRAREHLGREPVKAILLSNADNVASPVIAELNLMDTIVQMSLKEEAERWLPERMIYVHKVKASPAFKLKQAQSPIYKVMEGTSWAQMSLENEFGFNDLSVVGHCNMKGMKPQCSILYQGKQHWLYANEDLDSWYFCTSQSNQKDVEVYDLKKEGEQRAFLIDWVYDIIDLCTNGMIKFKDYSIYDLIINYKKKFKI